ncbi:MAG TPA: tetratricopeptide repeat protein [Gemmatimonadota bacterium]|nr:tetratricopeptide repeat protein [Gemmatimonadota bacterium]
MSGSRNRRWIVPGAALICAALAGLAVALPPRAAPPWEAYAAPDVSATSGAIAFFEGKLAGDPTNVLLAGHLTSRYMKRFQLVADLKDVERAEELARRVLLPLSRDRGEGWSRLAAILLARHEFIEAHAAAARAVAEDSDDATAWATLFDTAVAGGRYDEAREALTSLEPGSLPQRVRAAQWLDAHGRTESAFGRMSEACREIATWGRPLPYAWCLTELGGIELGRNGPRAAAALFTRALEVEPGYRGGVEGLADLAHARGDWAEAERLYRRIALDAHADLYLRLAEVRRARGDAPAADRWEREFLRVATAPGAEPLYGHPLALYWAARPETLDRALGVALRDVARRPAVESWDVLAWVRFRRGELQAALAASDRAFAWGAPSPTMEYHRARILAALARRTP